MDTTLKIEARNGIPAWTFHTGNSWSLTILFSTQGSSGQASFTREEAEDLRDWFNYHYPREEDGLPDE